MEEFTYVSCVIVEKPLEAAPERPQAPAIATVTLLSPKRVAKMFDISEATLAVA